LKKRNPRKYSWPVGICWTGTLKIGITRKYFLPVGICETDTFKKKYPSNIFPLPKNTFYVFLYLKVSVPHIPTDQEYFLGFLIFKSTCPTYSH
jgi:hypothetical protein